MASSPLAGEPGHPKYTLEREYRFEAGDMTALLLFSCITFFQQVGFASLESGSVRVKNTRNVLMKTLIDKLVSGIVYWAVGFAFAYGDTAAGLIGRSYFFLGDRFGKRRDTVAAAVPPLSDDQRAAAVLALWFSSWVFLITATTIVSGCLAERARFEAYLAYTPVMAGLAFPLAVHWAFHGWLSDATCSYIDFAGGSTVHLLGGAAGLAAALAVGPRLGRFHLTDRRDEEEAEAVEDEAEEEEEEEDDGGDGGAGDDERGGIGDAGNAAAADDGGGGGGGGGGTRNLASSSSAATTATSSGSAAAAYSSAASAASAASASSPMVSAAVAAAADAAATGANSNANGPNRSGGGGNSNNSNSNSKQRLRLRQRRRRRQQQQLQQQKRSSSFILRSRRRRQPFAIPGHNVESVTLGTMMLWFGWYGFNVAPSYLRGGPTLADRTAVAVRAAVSTTLSACASGLTALLVGYFFPSRSASYPLSSMSSAALSASAPTAASSSSHPNSSFPSSYAPPPPLPPAPALPPSSLLSLSPSPSPSSSRAKAATTNSKAIDLRTTCNGVLGGIVAATALCAYIEPWAAVAVGAAAGAALVFSSSLLESLGVDDPLDSVSVHGTCALVGLLGAALLASPAHLEAYRGSSANRECGGLFYLRFGRRGWEQLGVQVAGAAAISALSFALSALVFFSMRAVGVLRVDTATEIAGIDNVDHGGPAFHF